MLPAVRVELLGKLRFTFGQQLVTSLSTNRLQSLLAYLVLHSDVPQSREHLAFLLWPESNESQARTNLRQLLHHLRRALPAECSLLVTDNHTALWRADNSCSVDVAEFETAASRAVEAESKGDLASARDAFEQAARLYQDDLLPDLYDDWLQGKRDQLRQRHTEVLRRLASLLDAAGDYPAAIRHATRLVSADPLSEPSYQLLIRLHASNGDRSSALRVYHQCMRTLKRELGISPAKATQDLFQRALNSEQAPAAAERPSSISTTPLQLVGRKTEWNALLRCWHRVTQGDTSFALILGEPGVGKSRLADELFRHCSLHPGGAVARARCYFAQGRIAYGPVAEWLRSQPLAFARTQLPKTRAAELARVLPEILVENPEIAPPPPLTEGWQRRHLYEALNAVFAKAPKPLLLLIDDLQWCDHDSFEWLHAFFRSPASAGTLVLGTARAEEVDRDHPLTGLVSELRQSGLVSEFPLSPLSVEEASALAVQVAGHECDPAFLSRVYQATKGNPLFVVETVRAALEHGTSAGSPPPRVQAVIVARFAQLSPLAYDLAGLAAAIGRPFSFELLAKATDWDEDSLSRALEELWQRRIIDGQGAGTYDYTHDLIREVAYSELSPIRRRSWHRRVARALEELYAPDPEAVSGWLAAHYDAAGMPDRAIHWYRVAASVSKQRFAYTEAADQIQRALRLCRDFPESTRRDKQEIELLVMLGPSLVTTHGYSLPEVGETYERGLELSRRSGDGTHMFSLTSGAWLFRTVRGDLEESRRLGQACIDTAAGNGTQAVKMAGCFLLGTSLFHLGQLAASLKLIEQATPAGRVCDPALAMFAGPDLGVFCRAYSSHLHWLFGHPEQATTLASDAIALAHDLAHPFSLAIALDYAAMLSVFAQEADLALARAEEASALCRKYGFAYYLAWAEMLAGWATGVSGDAAAGLVRLRKGLDEFRAAGAELRLPFYYGLLAEVCSLAGHLTDALAGVSSAFAFQNKNGETWFAPELHRIHGDLLSLCGNGSESQASYQRAIESAKAAGAQAFELRAAARLSPSRGQSRVRRAPER